MGDSQARCGFDWWPVVLAASATLLALVFLLLVGHSQETTVRCDVAGLCAGGVVVLVAVGIGFARPGKWGASFLLPSLLRALLAVSLVFVYFGLTSLSPIFLVQVLTTVAALTFSASTCALLAWTVQTHGEWTPSSHQDAFSSLHATHVALAYLISLASLASAYVVLLLHHDVDGRFAGLSGRLSREEHLVLFSFGGFFISTSIGFLLLLLPGGRRLLGGNVEAKPEEIVVISRCHSKADEGVVKSEETHMAAQKEQETPLVEEQCRPSIPEESQKPSDEANASDAVEVVEEVQTLQEGLVPLMAPIQGAGKVPAGGAFPFPRGPSRPRRHCGEAWTSTEQAPKHRKAKAKAKVRNLTAVLEVDEEESDEEELAEEEEIVEVEGQDQPELQISDRVEQPDSKLFLAATATSEDREAPLQPMCEQAEAKTLDMAPRGQASSAQGRLPREEPSPRAQRSRPMVLETLRIKVSECLEVAGVSDIGLPELRNAMIASLVAHCISGLLLVLAGHMVLVALAMLSIKLFFLVARFSASPTAVARRIPQCPSPEISVTPAASPGSSSPLAKVPEAYAASWGFFPPDRGHLREHSMQPGHLGIGAMPAVAEEDVAADPLMEPSAASRNAWHEDSRTLPLGLPDQSLKTPTSEGEVSRRTGPTGSDPSAKVTVTGGLADSAFFRPAGRRGGRPGGEVELLQRPDKVVLPEASIGQEPQAHALAEGEMLPGSPPAAGSQTATPSTSARVSTEHFPSPRASPHLSIPAWADPGISEDSSSTAGSCGERKHSVRAIAQNARRWLRQGCQSAFAGLATVFVVLSITACQAAALLFIFLFDLVFIEKYVVSSLSRHFILAAENATCLQSRRLPVLAEDMLPSECAREVVRSTSLAAFSMGPPNSAGLRSCYPQDGLSEVSYADVFYGEDDDLCRWMQNPGFDFFIIEKQQPCSILGRGTSLILSNATAFSHRISDDLPRALSSNCRFCGELVSAAVDLARELLLVDVLVHRCLESASPGLRRIAAASMALGSAFAVLLLTLLDAFSFLSLALETIRLRSVGFFGSPLRFAIAQTAGQVCERLLLLLLHALLMAGMSFQLELANDFWPQLHCTHGIGSSKTAPNAWHQTARWTGTALVFFAAGISVFFAFGILGGYVYRFRGLVPARWATSCLYKGDVRMTRFAAAPRSMSDYRHEFLSVDSAEDEPFGTLLLRPGLGIVASMGFWHQKMNYAFQVGRRLEWYLLALPDAGSKTTVFTSDCVSWMNVVNATVNNLSIAWLLLPFGGLPARACLYLNERIVFAAGNDGGNSADEADGLMQHVLEDVSVVLQISGWLAAVGHLVTLLLLLFLDLQTLAHEQREQLIQGLLITGAVLAFVRSAIAQAQGLDVFQRRHGLVVACTELLQDALPSRVVQSHTRVQLKTYPRSRSEEQADALGIRPWHAGQPFVKAAAQRREKVTPLPMRSATNDPGPLEEECLLGLRGDVERVVSACRELLQLDWVRSGLLPGHLRGKLVAARAARNRRIRLAQALLASRRPGILSCFRQQPAASSGLFYGALLMALREVAEEDLIAQRCASEARSVVCEHLRQHCTLQARKLQLWLQRTARSQAARWAQALSLSGAVGEILEGIDCAGRNNNNNSDPEEPDDETTAEGAPPTWLAAPAEPQQDAEATSELEEEAKEKSHGPMEKAEECVDEDEDLGPRQQRLHAFLQSPGLPKESTAATASATVSGAFPPFDPATVRAGACLQPQAWESKEAPQTLRMLFAVSQQGLIRISGHWAAGGREVLPEKQARVNITAKAEVVLHWPKSARPSSSDAQVEFISHQIWPPLPPKPAWAGAGALLTKRSDTKLRTPCRRRLGSSWAQQNDELRWWERQVAGRGWLTSRRSPAAVSNMPNEEDRLDSLWRILCGVEWSASPEDRFTSAQDSGEGVSLPTELGQTRWSPPVALPALDPTQQQKFQPRCFPKADGGDLFQDAGQKLASLQVGGSIGLLGPIASTTPEALPVDDEVLAAAVQAAAAAASAAAHAPRAALRALEVAMRRNQQQLGAAFLTALYGGTGGLAQAEVFRRSWLMAAAARKLLKQKRSLQAEKERSQLDLGSGLLSEHMLFWTASRERKRWLRASERERMGLTFLGGNTACQAPLWGISDVGSSSTSPAKSAKSGLEAALEIVEIVAPPDAGHGTSPTRGNSGQNWIDAGGTQRNVAVASRRSSRGSASSDRVTPFECNAAMPMVVTEVDGADEFDGGPAPPQSRGSEPEASAADEAELRAEGARQARQQMVADFLQKASSSHVDVAELEKTLEEARQGAVDSAELAEMQKAFEDLMALQRTALGLLESLQSGSIRQLESRLSMAREMGLAPDAFADAAGDGVLKLAELKLEEQKVAAPGFLDAALDAFANHSSDNGVLGVGVIALQRCVDQARAAKIQDSTKLHRVEAKLHLLCERKREIALLKAAMAAEDAWLLKAATEECRQRFGEVTFGVDLTLAKCQLEIWEQAAAAQATPAQAIGEVRRPSLRLASQLQTPCEALDPERSDVLTPLASPSAVSSSAHPAVTSAQEERAVMALRAAMFQEPPQAGLLRLAIARARRAGVAKEEVTKAEAVLQEEREVEQALEQLRRAAAARDVRALRRAIADCADAGVDQRRLMPASTQLCETLGELLKRAHQHGLALSVLTDLDRERQELRYSLAEKRSGLRTVCRVRPPLAPELHSALRSHAGLAPVLRRVDRRTLEVALASGSYATCDFSAVLGPESTQAEVSSELLGLAQTAVDGGNVAVIACGQRGAGKSFTLCGSADQPGVLPRLLEELFAIKSKEHWRSEINIDVQALEIVDGGPPTDLLSQASEDAEKSDEQRIEVTRPSFVQGVPGRLCSAAAASIVSGAASRRAARLQELKDLVQEIWQQPLTSTTSRHAVLILQLARRNRLTGVTCRSRLLVADLAGASSPAVDRALSWAVACSARRGPRGLGVSSSNWSPVAQNSPAASLDGPGSQVLAALLQDCFGQGCTATMIVCLAPMTPDREGVLAVLEALGLRQSVVQTADTRAERRFQPPPEPLELPCTPKLPPSPVLLQQMHSSPVQSPTAQMARSSSNNSLFTTSHRNYTPSVSDSESLEEEDL